MLLQICRSHLVNSIAMQAKHKDQLNQKLRGIGRSTADLAGKIQSNQVHQYQQVMKELTKLESKIKYIKQTICNQIKTHEKDTHASGTSSGKQPKSSIARTLLRSRNQQSNQGLCVFNQVSTNQSRGRVSERLGLDDSKNQLDERRNAI